MLLEAVGEGSLRTAACRARPCWSPAAQAPSLPPRGSRLRVDGAQLGHARPRGGARHHLLQLRVGIKLSVHRKQGRASRASRASPLTGAGRPRGPGKQEQGPRAGSHLPGAPCPRAPAHPLRWVQRRKLRPGAGPAPIPTLPPAAVTPPAAAGQSPRAQGHSGRPAQLPGLGCPTRIPPQPLPGGSQARARAGHPEPRLPSRGLCLGPASPPRPRPA